MAARSPHARTPQTDLDRFIAARDLAHGWDPHEVDTRPQSVFREFGRYRWLIVPFAALVFAVFVWALGAVAGVPWPMPA